MKTAPGHGSREDQAPPSQADIPASILQLLPYGIAIYGADQRLRFVNDAYRHIMAGAPGAIGDTLADIVHARLAAGEYPGPEPEALARHELDLASDARPARRRRPNGTTIECRTVPLANGGRLAIITDISTLAEAQAEAARRADLLSSIVGHIPNGISVFGPDRCLHLVNDAYNQIMAGAPIHVGETIDEIIDRRARSGEYGTGDPNELAQSQRGHDKTRPQFRRRRRPGGTFIDVRTAPLPDGSHLSVVTDVTTIISAEAELARRAEALAALLANVRHGIILWDQDRRIIAANAVAATMLQVPEGLLAPGRSLADTIQAMLDRGIFGDGPPAREQAQRWAAKDRSGPRHERCRTRAGRLLDIRSEPISHGALSGGFVTTYADVTAPSDTEEALRLAQLAAEAAHDAKSRFFATMDSELRTPLMTILEQADSIARKAMDAVSAKFRPGESQRGAPQSANPSLVAEACGAIGTAALRLLGSIDTLLDVSRLESGRFDLADDRVDVAQLLRDVLRRFDAQAATAEVALVVDVPETMPILRADKRRLHEALCHVVSYAITSAGAPRSNSISLGARHDWARGNILLDIADNGPGLADAEIERAFEPFSPVEADGRAPGAGLGLFMSRILLRAHGGDLTLRSTPGQGTIATLLIPANRGLQDPARDTN